MVCALRIRKQYLVRIIRTKTGFEQILQQFVVHASWIVSALRESGMMMVHACSDRSAQLKGGRISES